MVELDIVDSVDPARITRPTARQQRARWLGIVRIELDDIIRRYVRAIATSRGDESRQPLRVHEIVAVHDGNPLAFC